MIDWNKPIRFVKNKKPAHYVGVLPHGRHAVSNSHGGYFHVDSEGNSCIDEFVVENIPEKIVRWVSFAIHDPYLCISRDNESDFSDCVLRGKLWTKPMRVEVEMEYQ